MLNVQILSSHYSADDCICCAIADQFASLLKITESVQGGCTVPLVKTPSRAVTLVTQVRRQKTADDEIQTELQAQSSDSKTEMSRLKETYEERISHLKVSITQQIPSIDILIWSTTSLCP